MTDVNAVRQRGQTTRIIVTTLDGRGPARRTTARMGTRTRMTDRVVTMLKKRAKMDADADDIKNI